MKSVLYISYDGMTDPLGQSQVLPYLTGLAQKGYKFTLVSFEKSDRIAAYKAEIEKICNKNNINWVPLRFTFKPKIISKIIDLIVLKRTVKRLQKQHQFDLVHCRSYVSAAMGFWLKKNHKVKFLFDIRGFWVDERVDGGLWNLNNPFFKLLYWFYKKKERKYFKHADHIITLTNASIPYLKKHGVLRDHISVIPCAADFDLFKIPSAEQKVKSRNDLSIGQDKLVISYLGSIGTWYLLDEMLLFFKYLKERYDSAYFLFITPEPEEKIISNVKQIGINPKNILVQKAQRKEVVQLMAASDISVYFIKKCFSKISSSPTKLGEILAMGLPVVTNTKIGDVDSIISSSKNGFLVNDFSKKSFLSAVDRIDDLLNLDAQKIRKNADQLYQLNTAIDKYGNCYKLILDE